MSIKSFFDGIQEITKRLPIIDELIVQIVLIGLVLLGAKALLSKHS